MAILTCERCGKQTAKVNKCDYCTKALCYDCVKSSKTVGKKKDMFICKSCWSNIPNRTKFKAAMARPLSQRDEYDRDRRY